MAKRALQVGLGGLVGIVVGVAALWLALRDADMGEIGAAFQRAGFLTVALATLVHVAVQLVYAARWRLLLGSAMGVPRLFGIVAIGYLANYTLPGRPGELVRAGLARGLGGVPLALGLASLVLEKVLDGGTILLSAGAFVVRGPEWLRTAVLIGGGLLTAASAAFALAALSATDPGALPPRPRGARAHPPALLAPPGLRPGPAGLRPDPPGLTPLDPGAGGRLALPLAFARRRLVEIAAPARQLADARRLVPVLLLGLATWLLILLHQAILCWGVGTGTGPASWLLLYAALGLASVVPGAPGYVGTYQLAAVLALSVFGVAQEPAFVVATLYQLSRLLGALVVSCWAIAREGMPAVRRAL